MQQIAAQFADVLEQRAVPADDIAPELPRRELLGDRDRSTADEHGASGEDAADAVIHRKAVVHAVGPGRVHEAREPVGPLHDPTVAHDCGLR